MIDRKKVMEQFVLDLSKPGQMMSLEQAVNLKDYGLSIKEDSVFLQVFDPSQYGDWMPSVEGMKVEQRRLESSKPPPVEEPEDIPTREEVHNFIQQTLTALKNNTPVPTVMERITEELPEPIQEAVKPGNLMDALPEHLKGLPEYEGTEDSGLPF